jgi:hypothetical protein
MVSYFEYIPPLLVFFLPTFLAVAEGAAGRRHVIRERTCFRERERFRAFA